MAVFTDLGVASLEEGAGRCSIVEEATLKAGAMKRSRSGRRASGADDTKRLVVGIVQSAQLSPEELPALIARVSTALKDCSTARESVSPKARPVPPVPIHESVTADYLVCLEDGRSYRLLTRLLAKRYGMTPAEYRSKWGLGDDYPMVAPNAAKLRSSIARRNGLGRHSR